MDRTERPPQDPELRRRITDLIACKGGGHNPDLVTDVIENALKLLKDVEHRGDVKVIQTAVRELRYAFRLFAPYAATRKVSIFGSARLKPEGVEYQQAVETGRLLADAGFMIITGAGPGIMQAGHEGAGVERSFGANIRLPWEQSANPVIAEDKKLVTFKYFFTRKLTFLRHSDAIVLFPGGFGTMDEGFEVLTLMQTGKARIFPFVLVDKPGGTYWQTWLAFLRGHLLKLSLVSEDDFNFLHHCETVECAVEHIAHFYSNYHSSRWVGGKLVIRLQHPLSQKLVEKMDTEFDDVLASGKFVQSAALPEESSEPDIAHLPRLVFQPRRRNFGRLRSVIDAVNRE